jgi:carbon storage regulator
MLLITRRSGEAIVINGTIEVKVLEVKSGRVKLGFEYPTGSSVFRQELFAKIQEENKAAAMSPSPDTARLGEVVRNLHLTGKGSGNPAGAQPERKDAGNDPTSNGTGKPSTK